MSKKIILILLSGIVGGAVVWFFIDQAPEAPLNPGSASMKDNSRNPKVEPFNPPNTSKTPNRPKESDESARRAAELEQFADSLKDKVVVDLGTVEEIGMQTAAMLLSQKELSELRAIPLGDRTASENQKLLELERQNATALGLLQEITSFQNNPDQYGRFFSALLHDAAGLNDVQTAGVFDYMKSRGESMIAAGLNAANEPDDPLQEQTWEDKRDEFNGRTAEGVAGMLAPGEAERIGFTPGFLELLEQDFDKAE